MIRGIYIHDARSAETFLNAPSVIASATVFGSVIWLLLAAAVAGEAAARDVETRMHPLTYTAPVSKADYLGGRFLAALALNASMLLAVYSPGVEAELQGPFRPAAYLTAYFFIALPNAFVATAIQFSWATLNRRGIASYIASVLLLITSHFVAGVVARLLGQWELMKLLDVVGIIGIGSGLLDTWSPIETNTRLIRLEGWLLANRLVWLGIALGVLTFTYMRFQFGHYTPSTGFDSLRSLRARWWSRIRKRRDAHSPSPTPISMPHVRVTFGFATYARQTIAIAWDSFRTIAKSRGGLTLVAAFAIPGALVASRLMMFMGVPLIPRTEVVIRALTPPLTDLQTPWVIIPLLIVFYAGELVWREREAGLSEMADAAPVPEWVLFLGKFLGLGFVLVAWLALVTATGILMQVDRGYSNFEVGLYLQALFGFQLANYLLFAVLALAVHVLVNQKYLGHLVALIAYGFIGFASRLGVEHNLLVYASDPGWTYTDMRGFEPFLAPWLWFKLYWAAWALLLAVAARLLWARGKAGSLQSRLQLARGRFDGPGCRDGGGADSRRGRFHFL